MRLVQVSCLLTLPVNTPPSGGVRLQWVEMHADRVSDYDSDIELRSGPSLMISEAAPR